ncbi:MAG: DNA-binding protein [bacterium]
MTHVKTKNTPFDVADHLRTTEEMAAYFEACMEGVEGDKAIISRALADIAHGKGMTQVARDNVLSRASFSNHPQAKAFLALTLPLKSFTVWV